MIKHMSKKAKGSIDNPNMRSSAKSGLNRSILQQSWGKFFELLEYNPPFMTEWFTLTLF